MYCFIIQVIAVGVSRFNSSYSNLDKSLNASHIDANPFFIWENKDGVSQTLPILVEMQRVKEHERRVNAGFAATSAE